MADLTDKLSQFGDVVIYTKANSYFTALNVKLNEATGEKLEMKKSYLSKYEVIEDLRNILREDFRTQKPEGSATSDEDYEIIKPLLDTSKPIIDIYNESEENYNKLADFLNDLATNVKGAFDPPIGEPFQTEDGLEVFPIPQAEEVDPRRFGRVIQFDPFTKATKDWLIDNSLLFGFTLYEDYGLYYIGFTDVQTQVQSEGVEKLVNKFQQTPIPAGEINISVSTITSAKDPVVGDLDIATLTAVVQDNDNRPFTELAVAPGGSQLLTLEACAAALQLAAAAKLDGINLSVGSGFRPAVNESAAAVRWTSASGKSGTLTTQLDIRRDRNRWVKSNSYYKRFVDPGTDAAAGTDKRSNGKTGKYGLKTGEQAFIYYAGASAYDAATAPPGHSNHGSGIAADFNTGSRRSFGAKMQPGTVYERNYIWLAKNAHKYGYVRAVSSEEWHWEYRPTEAPQGPYARIQPGSGGKLVNNGWYSDIGLDQLTA